MSSLFCCPESWLHPRTLPCVYPWHFPHDLYSTKLSMGIQLQCLHSGVWEPGNDANPLQHATQTQHDLACTIHPLLIKPANHVYNTQLQQTPATHNTTNPPYTTTCTTHPIQLSPQPSTPNTTLLCTQVTNTRHTWQNSTQVTNTRHGWQNGTRCRDGV